MVAAVETKAVLAGVDASVRSVVPCCTIPKVWWELCGHNGCWLSGRGVVERCRAKRTVGGASRSG